MQHRLIVMATALAVAVAVVVGARIAGPARALTRGTPSAPTEFGAVRLWGGTEIRSLDPTGRPRGSATAPALGARTATAATATATPRPDVALSNERTFTRWAYVDAIGAIRAHPARSAAQVGTLHWYTEDGFPEIYLALREHWDAQGRPWVLVRIPMRPNGRTGWVRRQFLSDFTLTHNLVTVDREHLRMTFSENGRVVWSAPVGVGAPATPTPAGHFYIRERFDISDPSSGYWPYAFGTSDYSTLTDWPGGGVVGIHGPYFANNSIPGHISHGCIRLHPADDSWLARHITLGTPVHVI